MALNPLDFFLVVQKSVSVFTARVNGTPSDPFVDIIFDGGATGTISSIGTSGAPIEGNTLCVGSSAGARDKGVVRVRSWTPASATDPTTGTLKIAESDRVGAQIVNDDFLTIKLDWRLWDKVPRIDATDPNNIIFFEDFDVIYDQQTVNWLPMALAGPPAAAFLEAGQAQVSFIGDRSYALAPGASLSSFLWTAHGSSELTSTSQGTEASPVVFTYQNAGQHLVSLKVTDSNGQTATNYTWAFIIDPASAADVAYTKFDAINDSFQAFQGGGNCNFVVHGVADITQFPAESQILHIARGTLTTATATWPNRSNILYNGFIIGNSISQDPIIKTTSFRTVTIDGLMKNLSIYPVRLEDSSNPQNWTQAKDLTVDRVLSFLAHWRSTLSLMTSVVEFGYTAELKAQDFNNTTLFAMFKALMADAWGLPVSDHQSVLHLIRDFNLMVTAERAAQTTRKTLHKGIWIGVVDVTERQEYERPTRKVKWSGIFYPGDEAAAVPLFSEAPGDVQDTWGNESAKGAFILTTQADLNTRTGFGFFRQNQQYPTITIRFLNDGSFSVAPQDIFPVVIEATDNNRGLSLSTDLIVRQIRRTYNHDGGFFQTDVSFEPSVALTVAAGVTIDMPVEPPSTSGGGVAPPRDPPPPPPAWPQPTISIPGPAVAIDLTDGHFITFDSGAVWTERNNLLINPNQLAFQYLIWDPWWFTSEKQNTSDPEQVILWGCGLGFIVRSVDAGKTWQDRTAFISDPPNVWEDSPAPTVADMTFVQVQGTIHTNQEFYFLASATIGGLRRGWVLKTDDDGISFTYNDSGLTDLITDGTFFYATNANVLNFCRDFGPSTWSGHDSANTLGLDDDVVGFLDKQAGATGGCQAGSGPAISFDFGVLLSTVTLEVKTSGNLSTTGKGITASPDVAALTARNHPSWVNPGFSNDWYTPGSTLTWSSLPQGAGSYQLFLVGVGVSAGNPDGSRINIDAARISGTLVNPLPEIDPIGEVADNQDGSILWNTIWNSDDGLVLQKRDTSDLSLTASFALGTSTSAELDEKTFIAQPFTPALFDNDILFVYGRMNAPQGLANPEHVIRTLDGGSSWTSVGDSATWGSGTVTAFFSSDTTTLFSFVNGVGRALFRTTDSGTNWANLSTLPFDVDPGAVSVHPDGRILISNASTGAQMVAYALGPDYSSWIDATDGFPVAGGGSKSIIWIT